MDNWKFDINALRGFSEGTVGWWIGKIVQTPGAVVFDNLPLFFAIGCGFGLAKDNRGEAALAYIIIIIITALLAEKMLPHIFYKNQMLKEWTVNGEKQTASELFYIVKTSYDNSVRKDVMTYILDIGVLGGIVVGCSAAYFIIILKILNYHKHFHFFVEEDLFQ